MITGRTRFNIYLWLVIASLAAGCATSSKTPEEIAHDKEEKEKDKLVGTVRVHVQVPAGGDEAFTTEAEVIRDSPIKVPVARNPFLTEASLSEAKVIDAQGGFKIQLQFDQHGSMLLEQYTSLNPGKRFAIFCTFGPPGQKGESRWLAAPVIPKRIGNGILVFTPDASREEAEIIVRGLSNVGKKVQKELKW